MSSHSNQDAKVGWESSDSFTAGERWSGFILLNHPKELFGGRICIFQGAFGGDFTRGTSEQGRSRQLKRTATSADSLL